MQRSKAPTSVVMYCDEFGRYVPIAHDNSRTDDEDSVEKLLRGFFRQELFVCAGWYRKFVADQGAGEIQSHRHSLAKEEGRYVLRYRRDHLSYSPECAASFSPSAFLEALDGWCDIVERGISKVRLVWDGERIEFEEL